MTHQKHEWRKSEKDFYLPKNKPEIIEVPAFKFITIKGEGSPTTEYFAQCIAVLYKLAYTIKMTLKKEKIQPEGYCDYTVYPLEGLWDLNDEAKKNYTGSIDKNDFVYTLMIRQPDFITQDYFEAKLEEVKKKGEIPLLDELRFEEIKDGRCIQMLHKGSFDDEPISFQLMEKFAEKQKVVRQSKMHREIYLSDFRKVPTEKLKTVLRFRI